jgi:hypothetical protein
VVVVVGTVKVLVSVISERSVAVDVTKSVVGTGDRVI